MDGFVKKPKYLRELGAVDVNPITQMLSKASPAYWTSEDAVKENKFNCFQHTQHIILRFIKENRDPNDFYDGMGWKFFEPVLLPIFDKVVKNYNFSEPVYPKVMFARLKAKQQISVHRDGEGSHLYTHKIHIPLQTSPTVRFQLAEKQFHLRQGMAYEVNNIISHGVINQSDQDRVHLIFEVFDNKK